MLPGMLPQGLCLRTSCSPQALPSPSLCQTERSSFPQAPQPSPVCDLYRCQPISLDPSLHPHLLSFSPASSSSSSRSQPGCLLYGPSLALQAPPTVCMEYFVSRFHCILRCFSPPEQTQGHARRWVPSEQGLALPHGRVFVKGVQKSVSSPEHCPLQPLLGALSGPTPSRS